MEINQFHIKEIRRILSDLKNNDISELEEIEFLDTYVEKLISIYTNKENTQES